MVICAMVVIQSAVATVFVCFAEVRFPMRNMDCSMAWGRRKDDIVRPGEREREREREREGGGREREAVEKRENKRDFCLVTVCGKALTFLLNIHRTRM